MVAPLVAAAGIGAVGSVLGGVFGSSSAKKAARYQLQATREQIAATNQNRDYQYGLNAPTISRGENASNLYAGFLGAGPAEGTPNWDAYLAANPDVAAGFRADGRFSTPQEYAQYHYNNFGKAEGRNLGVAGAGGGSTEALEAFRGSTGYQDLLKTGLGAVNSNAYARGMGDSGATLKALQDRGTSIADSSAQSWLGNLGTLINAGGQARGLVAGVGTNAVAANNAATQSGADARSNAALQTGAMWNSNIQNLLNAGAYAYGSSYGGGGQSMGRNAYGISGGGIY